MSFGRKKGLSPLTLLLLMIDLGLLIWIVTTMIGEKKAVTSPSAVIPSQPNTAQPSAPQNNTPVPKTVFPENVNAEDNPDFSDFAWFIEDAIHTGLPDEYTRLTDFGDIEGTWKVYILYDPDSDNPADMLFLADISASQNGVEFLCRWHYIKYANDAEPAYRNTQSQFYGTWENGILSLEGPGTIYIDDFRAYSGRQYACGRMANPHGVPALIALVRP